jgi:hypothetical protein
MSDFGYAGTEPRVRLGLGREIDAREILAGV